MRMQIHATCVALGGHGVLLRGPSGAGKSDLALRLIVGGARLIADDRVDIANEDGAVIARAPATLAGLMEVRGLGILRMEFDEAARVTCVIDLVAPADVKRLPEPAAADLCGVEVPLFQLDAFSAAAAAKVRLAVEVATGRIMRADE